MYEVVNMKVIVVLGYKLNDDASMDNLLIKRLELCLKLLSEEHYDKVILSGGCPTPPGLDVSEAEAMANYLISKGISEDIIIKENKSLTTEENALYSIPICKQLNAKNITVITTMEHMSRDFLNPVRLFAEQLRDNRVTLMFMTDSE